MTPHEFIRARLDEWEGNEWDQEEGRPHTASCGYDQSKYDVPCYCAWPGRLVAAIRAVLDAYASRAEQADSGSTDGHALVGYHATGLMVAIRALAGIWSDHPDYQPEWA